MKIEEAVRLKRLAIILVMLSFGLLAGCSGSVAGSEAQQAVRSGPEAVSKSSISATATSLPAATATAAPTETPATEPTPTVALTSTPTQAASATPAVTVEPTSAVTATVTLTSTSAIEKEEANPAALAEAGRQVYLDQYCGICHELKAANTGGLFGPPQNQIGTVAEQRIQDSKYHGEATTAAAYIRESILNPSIYLVEGYEQSRHHMPAFTHLSESELDALVAFLLQQK